MKNIYHKPNIISLPYTSSKLLSFRVEEARQGKIMLSDRDIALQCQIRGITYTLTREHLNTLSESQRNDLYRHLGVNSNLWQLTVTRASQVKAGI
ncbi:hypothetical protein [Lyngbya aestuarii]|uniref:hypothetical protein n=1 Tax=Lyngbya aestuarii TaxID=118322 RepID=UPI00403D91B4